MEKFQTRKNVFHALGTLDEKHMAMKKLKRSGSKYYNYKGIFSLVLLALVGVRHRFLWVDVESSESSSDSQIFNQRKMREKIEDGILELLAPETLGEGGPDLHFF